MTCRFETEACICACYYDCVASEGLRGVGQGLKLGFEEGCKEGGRSVGSVVSLDSVKGVEVLQIEVLERTPHDCNICMGSC